MVARFFGQYLLEKGIVGPKKLLEAVGYQESRNRRLGSVAVTQGMMTVEQVEQLHVEQRRTDRLFGELAIERGFLRREQLDELLRTQQAEHVFIGQSLVKVGALTQEQLERELVAYHGHLRGEGPLRLALPAPTPDGKRVAQIAEVMSKLLRRLGQLVNKMSSPEVDRTALEPVFLESAIWFKGALEGRYVIRSTRPVAEQLARAMSGVETRRSEREVADAVAEFGNVVAGNVVARFSTDGLTAEISPPEFTLNAPARSLPKGTHGVVYTFHTTCGDIQMIFESVAA